MVYYLEPDVDRTGRNGILFANLTSRPWDEMSLSPLDLKSDADGAMRAVRDTVISRYDDLVNSDATITIDDRGTGVVVVVVGTLPRYLPPRFPLWDRELHRRMSSNETLIFGSPPRCCPPMNADRDDDVDCASGSPRNCPPRRGWGARGRWRRRRRRRGGTDGDDRKGILRNSLEAYAGILSTVGIGITIDVRSDDHIHGKERDVGWTIRRTEGTHSHDVDAVAIERTRAKCAWDVGSRRIPSTMPGRYKPRVHHREVWYLREERKT